jgi:hypothetical protein
MVRKVNKTFSLPLSVVEELEEEDNQSKVVEELLRKKYDA